MSASAGASGPVDGPAKGRAARASARASVGHPRRSKVAALERSEDRSPYINRELSWLEFNARVLFEARDERNPLIERVRFLTIFAANLDEFFQVRVSGLRQQVATGSTSKSPDGRMAAEQIAAAATRVRELVSEQSAIWVDVRRSLAANDNDVGRYKASVF
jgi:polyphosphate kinase